MNNQGQNFFNFIQKIKNNGSNSRKSKYILGSDYNIMNKENGNKSQMNEIDKNNNSNDLGNNDINEMDNLNTKEENNRKQRNKEFLSEKKRIIRNYIIPNNSLNEKGFNNTLMASTNFDNNNINNKLLLNENQNKLLFNSLFPSINKRNHKKEDFSFFHSEKKRKRCSEPLVISYDVNFNSEKDKIFKHNCKRNKKINMRSFSAQRFNEQDIKKSVLDYQNNYKELNKFYNNISGKNSDIVQNKNSNNLSAKRYFDIKNGLKNLNILNSKKIVINKFSSSSLFMKNFNKNKNV